MKNNTEGEFLEQLNEIVSKGKIESDEEYKILLQKVEDIHDKEESEDEVKKINKLLSDFHSNKIKSGKSRLFFL